MSSIVIKINDIFEEMNEENRRLLNDLIFANECLLKLIKFKTFVELIFDKIRYNLEEFDSKKYQNLNEEVNEVLRRKVDVKNSKANHYKPIENLVNNYENDIKLTENYNDLSDDSNDPDYDNSYKMSRRVKISRKNKQNRSKSLVKRATINLNQKNKTKRGRKIKSSTDRDIDSNGIKPKKELIVCDYGDCDQVFKTKKSYETHKRVIHLKIRPFVCQYPDCNFDAINKSQLEKHEVIHSDERPFICEVKGCGKRFKSETTLNAHQKGVHSGPEERFKCDWPGCEYKTARKRHLQNHVTKHVVSEKTIACDWPECDKMFRLEDQMREHRRIHTAVKRHSCNWPGCQYRTYHAHVLKQHMMIHSDVRSFVCDIDDCGKAFKTVASLYGHKKWSHFVVANPSRDFKCQYEGCGKDFTRKDRLTRHSKRHLPKVANIRCDWPGCTFVTVTAENLRRHHYVHQDYSERKYVCDWPECAKRFKDKSRLNDHFRKHTNERRYACTYPGCTYRCVIKGNLTKHMAKHKI